MSERGKDVLTILIIVFIIASGLFVGSLIKKQEALQKVIMKNTEVVTVLEKSNQELRDGLDYKELTIDLAAEIIKENLVEKQKKQEQVDFVQKETIFKVKKKQQETQVKISKAQSEEEINEIKEQDAKEVSRLRITGLWQSYCLDEPNEVECKGVT